MGQSQSQNLFQACKEGDLEKVKLLVENKADITAEHNTALIEASYHGQLEIVKFLLENKADIAAENNEALQEASLKGHSEIVKFLIENKADVAAKNNAVIRLASYRGHLETVKFLVENKADITAENNGAIRLARENERTEVVKYLESLSNPPPLSNQALLKMKEKHLPKQVISEFLERNLKNIAENLSLDKQVHLELNSCVLSPMEEVVNIVISWFKEKGLENAENRVDVSGVRRAGDPDRSGISITVFTN